MKIYLFNPETGVYLGEDFADEAPMKSGAFVIPPGATTIAPPEGGRGHIMVFVVDAQCWEVHTHWEQEDPQLTNLAKPLPMGIHCYSEQEKLQLTNVAKLSRTEIHYYSGSFLISIGFLLWFWALCDNNKYIGVMCGLSLIVGSAAYMSLKERMLDPTRNTRLRKCLELSAIVFIFLGYLWESCSPRMNNANILLSSVTPITSIAIYFYCFISWLKRVLVSRYLDSNIQQHPFLVLLMEPMGSPKNRAWL